MRAKCINEEQQDKFVSKFITKKLDKAWDFYDNGGVYLKFEKNNVNVEIGLEKLENEEIALFIEDIFTDPYYQNKGYASKILKEITNYADNHDMWIALRASIEGHYNSPTFLNQEQLISWYVKNGFILDPEASIFGHDEIFMTREPNKIN